MTNNPENVNNPLAEEEEPQEEKELPDDVGSQANAENAIPDVDFDALNGTGADQDARPVGDAPRGSKLEWLEEAVSDETIEANSILVPKDRRGKSGGRDYLRNLNAAMTPLNPSWEYLCTL